MEKVKGERYFLIFFFLFLIRIMKKEGTFSDDDDDLHSLGTGVGVVLPVFRWAAANTVRPQGMSWRLCL